MTDAGHNKSPASETIEAWVLTDLGYTGIKGMMVPDTSVPADKFLNAYPPNSPHKTDTLELMEIYKEAKTDAKTDANNPEFIQLQRIISDRLTSVFGPPVSK